MSLESDIAVLRQVPLFADLTADQLRLLAFGAEHRRLKSGETLFRVAARADEGFVIVSGEITLKAGPPGAEVPVAGFGPGALLGELALITETRRAATALADGSCDLIRIPRTLFRRMLEEYPDLAVILHERISDQLARMMQDITALEHRFTD